MKIPELVPCKKKVIGESWMPPHPAGYFMDGQWFSRYCKTRQLLNSAQEGECLKNKTVYFFGDSTIRQWYAEYSPWGFFDGVWRSIKATIFHPVSGRGIFGVERHATDAIWSPRTAYDSYYNISFKFSAHGPPLQNGGDLSTMPYIADGLDSIDGHEGTYVVITIGLHFLLYHPSLFISRLKTIIDAIYRLHERSPSTMVFFKGLNSFSKDDFASNFCCLSDWLAYRYDSIAQSMFKDVPGIVYLDSWDITTAHYNSENNGLHPSNDILRMEIEVFLSFVCP